MKQNKTKHNMSNENAGKFTPPITYYNKATINKHITYIYNRCTCILQYCNSTSATVIVNTLVVSTTLLLSRDIYLR